MRFEQFKFYRKYSSENIVPALEEAKLYKEADKVASCGSYVNTAKCNHCGTNHFKSFQRCKSKFCPTCSNVKSKLWVAHLVEYIQQWLSQGHYAVFCNYTIKNTDTLQEGLDILEGAWRNMTGKQYRKAFMSYFPGGFKAIEVTIAKDNTWHPHIHSILLKREYRKDVGFARYVWRGSVRKMGGVCLQNPEFYPFGKYDRKSSHYNTKEEYLLDITKNIKEVCKYITKFDFKEESPEHVVELYTGLKGKRQYAVWGVLADIRKKIAYQLENHTDTQLEDFVCQVCGCTSATPNKVYEYIWNDDEYIMKDYMNTANKRTYPDKVIDGYTKINRYFRDKAMNMNKGTLADYLYEHPTPPPKPTQQDFKDRLDGK